MNTAEFITKILSKPEPDLGLAVTVLTAEVHNQLDQGESIPGAAEAVAEAVPDVAVLAQIMVVALAGRVQPENVKAN